MYAQKSIPCMIAGRSRRKSCHRPRNSAPPAEQIGKVFESPRAKPAEPHRVDGNSARPQPRGQGTGRREAADDRLEHPSIEACGELDELRFRSADVERPYHEQNLDHRCRRERGRSRDLRHRVHVRPAPLLETARARCRRILLPGTSLRPRRTCASTDSAASNQSKVSSQRHSGSGLMLVGNSLTVTHPTIGRRCT